MKRNLAMLLLALALLFFSGCGEQSNGQQTCIGVQNDCQVINNNGGSTQQTIPTTQPTAPQQFIPTATPAPQPGDMLCQANWSSDLNGWTGTSDWKVLNGNLLNDGTNGDYVTQPSILAPCDLNGSPDYRVDVKIQMQNQDSDPGFGFFVRYRADTQAGYMVGNTTAYGQCDSICALSIAPASAFHSPILNVNFTPGNNIREYIIEVKGNNLKVFVDGGYVTGITDNKSLEGGSVGFFDKHTQITISSFIVTAL